jgi:uncharacterized protein (DUF1330 family)
MVAYMIVQRTAVLDPAGMEDYRSQVGALLSKYGAVARASGPCEVAEGDWMPERLVILEFPSMARIKEFYDGPDYAALKALRQGAARTNLVFIDGL